MNTWMYEVSIIVTGAVAVGAVFQVCKYLKKHYEIRSPIVRKNPPTPPATF